jgi:hypothetical protein
VKETCFNIVDGFNLYVAFSIEERTSFSMYFGIGGETLSTENDSLDDFNSSF